MREIFELISLYLYLNIPIALLNVVQVQITDNRR